MPTVEGHGYGLPSATGLYDPKNESEACGVGFVVSIDGIRSHKVSEVEEHEVNSSKSTFTSLNALTT